MVVSLEVVWRIEFSGGVAWVGHWGEEGRAGETTWLKNGLVVGEKSQTRLSSKVEAGRRRVEIWIGAKLEGCWCLLERTN